jgi:hypothetical protein
MRGLETVNPDGPPAGRLRCELLLEQPLLVTVQEVWREAEGWVNGSVDGLTLGGGISRVLTLKHPESSQTLAGEDLKCGFASPNSGENRRPTASGENPLLNSWAD